jgi:hypothetical protein
MTVAVGIRTKVRGRTGAVATDRRCAPRQLEAEFGLHLC